MCGIVGILSRTGAQIDENDITVMRNQLIHRGPDSLGIHISETCGLGHSRLSILDLSAAGHQPMSNESGNVWIIFNGEIYNFIELRKELEERGHKFRSRTDTEVIIHAYEQWGEDCVKRFNGMFAIALWDDTRKRIFLARDRLGVKPLFYYFDSRWLLFASEIKSILKFHSVDRQLDRQAISDFLSMNYVPLPLTPFQKIKSLLPGHYLIHENDNTIIQKYWDIEFGAREIKGEEELTSQLEEMIEQSVRKRMIADVPLGAFLSGGLDSSSIVYFMRKHSSAPLKTFNVAFDESSYDESEFAHAVAKKLDTTHFEVRCRAVDLQNYFSNMIEHADCLHADNSNLAVFMVSKLAHEHVKVVLTGDGGDEIFGGYLTYQADQLAKHYRRIPQIVRSSLLNNLIRLLPSSNKKLSLESMVKRFAKGAEFSPAKAHYYWRIIFDDDQKSEVLSKDFLPSLQSSDSSDSYRRYYDMAITTEELEKCFYADIKVFLAGSILSKVDNMTMAHSLESRSPFLDFELVEKMAVVPVSLKLRGLDTKYLLRRIMAGKLPKVIVRRRKAGFNLPLGKWFREDLRDFVNEILSKDNVEGLDFLNWDFIYRLKQEHFLGTFNHDYRIWGLMCLVGWHQRFCE